MASYIEVMGKQSRHPLAALRAVVGVTQQELASLLVVGTQSIRQIESPKARDKLSPSLAAKIADLTGCDASSLLGDGPPFNQRGDPYGLGDFEAWQTAMTKKETAAARKDVLAQCGEIFDGGKSRARVSILKRALQGARERIADHEDNA